MDYKRRRIPSDLGKPRAGDGYVYAILERLEKIHWRQDDPVLLYCDKLRRQGFFFRPSDTKEPGFEFVRPPGPPGVDNIWQNEDKTHDAGCPKQHCLCKSANAALVSPQRFAPVSPPIPAKIEASHTQPLEVIEQHLDDFYERNGQAQKGERFGPILHSNPPEKAWEFENVEWPRTSTSRLNNIYRSESYFRVTSSEKNQTQSNEHYDSGLIEARQKQIKKDLETREELCTCEGHCDEIIYHGRAQAVRATYGFLQGSRLGSAVLI